MYKIMVWIKQDQEHTSCHVVPKKLLYCKYQCSHMVSSVQPSPFMPVWGHELSFNISKTLPCLYLFNEFMGFEPASTYVSIKTLPEFSESKSVHWQEKSCTTCKDLLFLRLWQKTKYIGRKLRQKRWAHYRLFSISFTTIHKFFLNHHFSSPLDTYHPISVAAPVLAPN